MRYVLSAFVLLILVIPMVFFAWIFYSLACFISRDAGRRFVLGAIAGYEKAKNLNQ
jgi:hypothetical protein